MLGDIILSIIEWFRKLKHSKVGQFFCIHDYRAFEYQGKMSCNKCGRIINTNKRGSKWT